MSENKGLRDTPRSRVVNDAYADGYDRIFGKDHKAQGTRRERQSADPAGPMVMGDIQPYRSVLDGSWITSRSQHRAHLQKHGVTEVGNEKLQPSRRPEPSSKDIIQDLRDAREIVRNRSRYFK